MKRSRGLPRNAVAAADDDWVSFEAAATRLHVSGMAVGHYVAADRLVAARNSHGESGVTKTSLEVEWAWRRTASKWKRAWRRVRESWVYL